MSTGVVHELPDRRSLRSRVAAEVRAEMARARLSGNRLAQVAGKSQAYWSRRISGDVAFDVDDLAVIADVLGIDVATFFGAHVQNPRPDGPDGGQMLPRLDSNQQPSGYTNDQASGATVIDFGSYRELEETVERAA